MCRCQHEPSAVKHLIIAAVMLAHSWYPRECCHEKDCLPVPCAELSYQDKDVVWRKHIYFSGRMIREIERRKLPRLRRERPQRQHHSLRAAVRFRPASDELKRRTLIRSLSLFAIL
jgi:hypothetical protein